MVIADSACLCVLCGNFFVGATTPVGQYSSFLISGLGTHCFRSSASAIRVADDESELRGVRFPSRRLGTRRDAAELMWTADARPHMFPSRNVMQPLNGKTCGETRFGNSPGRTCVQVDVHRRIAAHLD